MDCLYIAIFSFLLHCVSTASDDSDVSNCPYNLSRDKYLVAYKDRCFQFVIYRETYWQDAQNECKQNGGRLVTVRGVETQVFLENTLQKLGFSRLGVWIGLNDQRIEDTYEWVSGEAMRFTNWARGEPSLLHGIEDCIIMERLKGYRWSDHPCHLPPQHFEFICEYDRLPESTTRSTTTMQPTTTMAAVATQEIKAQTSA